MPACQCDSFPWSLVLCWLCSCFPLRSGTPDDGRPRYGLCSFSCHSSIDPSAPIVLRNVCVSLTCAGLKLPIWAAVVSLIFLTFSLYFSLYSGSSVSWVCTLLNSHGISFHKFSLFNYSHLRYLLCCNGGSSSKGRIALRRFGCNIWLWKIASRLFKLILIQTLFCNACWEHLHRCFIHSTDILSFVWILSWCIRAGVDFFFLVLPHNSDFHFLL